MTAGEGRPVRILALCDEVDARLYGPRVREHVGEVDLMLSCGDLPPYYLDYVQSMLNVPLYGVHGNHDAPPGTPGAPRGYGGMVELHARVVREQGLLIGGFDGSLRYNDRPQYQYTQAGMRRQVARMLPRLAFNRLRHGRYLDILLTHAPPRGIHDQPDRCHQGFDVFRWFLRTFRPRYHLHGHIHLYNRQTVTRTTFHATQVVNVFPYCSLALRAEPSLAGRRLLSAAG